MRIGISFGANASPIADQVRKQGRNLEVGQARRFQGVADAITLLAVHGILANKATHAARRKLHLRIKRAAK